MPEPAYHEYHYGSEAEQYTFYRLPKALFTGSRYKCLSDGAKILYGLMLDRMALSMKNGWLDDRNRVYIFFTLEDVQEYMSCKHEKAVKMLAELDTQKGVGLIERVKQGQGRPTIIYVKKFIGPDFGESEVKTSEKQKSALPNMP
ncbi:replication initiator protein A, partial [Ruminococcaceae bacterium OttesenSCG-928-L11]|nr:replication initiator protein A [Ruminococcaceae bacterium OttesenSCG-928-L11]